MRINKLILFTVLFLHGILLMRLEAQVSRKCASAVYQQFFLEKHDISKAEFEEGFKYRRGSVRTKKSDEVFIIPIVVHVVHNTQSGVIGGANNGNISDEQIASQIAVLNEDFRRLNADTSLTPDIFKSLANDAKIEFRLANIDPEGNLTSGITRSYSNQLPFDANRQIDDLNLKTIDYWPSTQYLNIWVTSLSDDVLGYASFPSDASSISGLQGINIAAERDGVVIDHFVFGKGVGTVSQGGYYANGRTTTHEVGHWLGLYHIWGDADNCNATDYCDDTPKQEVSSEGCPENEFNCNGERYMYENYMDYSADACMNLFTQGQIDRMRGVLEVSPRRSALLSSPGLCQVQNMVDLPFEEVFDQDLDTTVLWTGTVVSLEMDGAVLSNSSQGGYLVSPVMNIQMLEKPFLGLEYVTEQEVTLVIEYAKACSDVWQPFSEERLIGSQSWVNVSLQSLESFQGIQFRFRVLESDGEVKLKQINVHSETDVVSIAPNPVYQEITLMLSYSGRQAVKVRVYDLNGNVVLEQLYPPSFSESQLLSTSGLPSGVYILSIDVNGQFVEKKIVKLN